MFQDNYIQSLTIKENLNGVLLHHCFLNPFRKYKKTNPLTFWMNGSVPDYEYG